MTDHTLVSRELLKSAALAAGIGLYIEDEPWCSFRFTDDNTMVSWNPLDDDGDALRLAVKLNFFVYYFPEFESAIADFYDHENPEASMRLAIVHAAAVIASKTKL